jgi:hypothetical protein
MSAAFAMDRFGEAGRRMAEELGMFEVRKAAAEEDVLVVSAPKVPTLRRKGKLGRVQQTKRPNEASH